ncbi:MAG: MBL fold metallo-hydrolase [Enterobacterales bacterium]|nr:MBL fold metallo-hydrolase [Enterobacterales bacterium]
MNPLNRLNIPLILSTLLILSCADKADKNGSPNQALATKTMESPYQLYATEKYPASQVDMMLEKLSEHVYFVQGKSAIATQYEGFISNAVAIITKNEVVVFDALGSPSLAQLLVQKIREISDKPITKIVVSHYHADHIYGLQVFKSMGAKIIAPYGYADYLNAPIAQQRLEERRKSLAPWVNQNTHLILPDQVVDSTYQFKAGDVDLVINYLGNAHSDGDLTLYVVQDNILLSGDLIFEGRIPFTGNSDTKHWLELINHLKDRQLAALVPGHGGIVSDPNAAMQLTQRYLSKVREKMQFGVDEMMTFDETYDAVDWTEFENLPAFKEAHRKNAYGIFLTLERESLE